MPPIFGGASVKSVSFPTIYKTNNIQTFYKFYYEEWEFFLDFWIFFKGFIGGFRAINI